MKKTLNPYIIALDMDGTLLNSKKKISFKTANYLRKLSRQGHKIIIASGRPRRSIETYYNQLKLDTPVIGYNGEYIYSPNDKNFKTVSNTIPREIILEIIEKIKPTIINVMCETDDEIWVDKEDNYLNYFFWYKNMNVHVGELKNTLDKDTMTCIFHVPEEYRDSHEIDKILEKWPNIVSITWIGKPYFELHHRNSSKGDSLRVIANYYNIPKERIISFGDATNDVEMFELAKTSVLMKNAKYDLKDKVTYVSFKDNDHNGIYYTLKKIFKNNL